MSDAPRISITMALDALTEQCEEVIATRAAYEQALATRDATIRDMREARVPVATLAKRTRLSRDSILRIATSAPRDVSQP